MKDGQSPDDTRLARIGADLGARRAERYRDNPEGTLRLVDAAMRKAEGKGRGALAKVWEGFKALIRLTRAYATRRYTRVPWKTMVYVVGAIVYFVSPFDLIPDFLVGFGLFDDAAVIGWVLRSIKKDLDAFREWEIESGEPETE